MYYLTSNKIDFMNITTRIEELINRHGLSKSELARRMGKYNQQINRLITNPKWETVEAVASALGCPVWHLFLEDIEAAGYHLTQKGNEQTEMSDRQEEVRQKQGDDGFNAATSEQPFDNSPEQSQASDLFRQTVSTPLQQPLVCPHCHKAMMVTMITPL